MLYGADSSRTARAGHPKAPGHDSEPADVRTRPYLGSALAAGLAPGWLPAPPFWRSIALLRSWSACLMQFLLLGRILLEVRLLPEQDVLVDQRLDVVRVERERLVLGLDALDDVVRLLRRRQAEVLRTPSPGSSRRSGGSPGDCSDRARRPCRRPPSSCRTRPGGCSSRRRVFQTVGSFGLASRAFRRAASASS